MRAGSDTIRVIRMGISEHLSEENRHGRRGSAHDFGVAALLLDANRDHEALQGGTPGYAAPEVEAGGAATAAADIWALGVLTAELITGKRPAGPGDLSALPPDLRPVVAAALSANPRERPSARAMAAKLRSRPQPSTEAADEQQTRLRPGTTPPPPAPAPAGQARTAPVRRLAIAAAAVFVVALLVGVGVLVGRRGETGTTAAAQSPAAPTTEATTAAEAPAGGPAIDQVPVAAQDTSPDRATYAAHLPNDAGTLYIAVRDGQGKAYLCDGDKVEAWFKGTADNGQLAMPGVKAGKLTGTFSQASADGTVTVKGRAVDFKVPMVVKPSALYRASAKVRNAKVDGAWIVLPSGQQVGVLTTDGTPAPAPSLDTTTLTADVDGTAVPATEIDVYAGTGF
jgi:hypothetical protein